MNNQIVSRHGFDCKKGINCYQITSWIYFILDTVMVYLIYLPHINLRYQILLIGWLTLNNIMITLNCILTASINPSYIPKVDGDKQNKQYCMICKFMVEPKTKHCSKCNRCTHNFDHHCIWINNCVGSANYRYFMLLLIFLNLYRITKYILNIWIVISISDFSKQLVLVYGYVSIVLDLLINFWLVYLLVFHVYLIKKGISTYEWIRNRYQKYQMTQGISSNKVNEVNWEEEQVEVEDQQSIHAQKPMQEIEVKMGQQKNNKNKTQSNIMESINRFKVNMQDMMVEVNEQSIIMVQSSSKRDQQQ